MGMARLITNLETFADLFDRLAIEINKVSVYENLKREESSTSNPDDSKIARWDKLSRDANELRSALKSRINSMLAEIVRTGTYETMTEPRTFSEADSSIAELLDDISWSAAKTVRARLSEEFKKVL